MTASAGPTTSPCRSCATARPTTGRSRSRPPPADVDAGTHPNGLLASGTLTFAGDGALQSAALTPVVSGGRRHAGRHPVGGRRRCRHRARSRSTSATIGGVDGVSQFASPTNVAFVNQNGAEVGELNAVSIDDQGYVIASFTNGEERRLYRLPVATFANPGGARSALGQCLRPDRRLGRIQPARRRHGRCRRRGPLGARGRERRPRRGVHQDDRHAAGLLGQCQDHQHHRPDARRADPDDQLSACCNTTVRNHGYLSVSQVVDVTQLGLA